MIDQLIKLVQANAGDAIVNNQAIPNQQNDAAIETVARQIMGGLQQRAAQGDVSQVTSLFNGADLSAMGGNSMVGSLISNVAGEFAGRFGVSPQIAQSIASGLIPTVMNQFVNKTNDPNDKDFDLQDMLKGFTGGGGGGGGLNLGELVGGGGSGGGLADMLGKILK